MKKFLRWWKLRKLKIKKATYGIAKKKKDGGYRIWWGYAVYDEELDLEEE